MTLHLYIASNSKKHQKEKGIYMPDTAITLFAITPRKFKAEFKIQLNIT